MINDCQLRFKISSSIFAKNNNNKSVGIVDMVKKLNLCMC